MSAPIVHVPDPVHDCGPNRYGIWLDFGPDQRLRIANGAPGTVRECGECGKSWVAYIDEFDPGYVGVKWRREGWFARRRRVRKPMLLDVSRDPQQHPRDETGRYVQGGSE